MGNSITLAESLFCLRSGRRGIVGDRKHPFQGEIISQPSNRTNLLEYSRTEKNTNMFFVPHEGRMLSFLL